jgi:glutamate synthase (NADPH/NADH) small chain
MGAYPFEYELAKSVGVKGIFNSAPLRIVGTERAEGVEFIRTREVNGRLENIPGSEFIIPAELVLKATGQGRQHGFLQLISGLELDSKGNIVTDAASFQTKNSRYYAAGDAVSGGQEVVNAVANGKKAAIAMAAAMGIEVKA